MHFNSFLFVLGDFELTINKGEFTDSQIIVMLGENGTGKTTFIKMLAGHMQPDSGGRQAGVGCVTDYYC